MISGALIASREQGGSSRRRHLRRQAGQEAAAARGAMVERKCDIRLEPYPHTTDRSDPVAYANSKEQAARESLVAKARVKIARAAVSECYHKEGVNHYQNCQGVVQKYLDLIWRQENYGALKPPSDE